MRRGPDLPRHRCSTATRPEARSRSQEALQRLVFLDNRPQRRALQELLGSPPPRGVVPSPFYDLNTAPVARHTSEAVLAKNYEVRHSFELFTVGGVNDWRVRSREPELESRCPSPRFSRVRVACREPGCRCEGTEAFPGSHAGHPIVFELYPVRQLPRRVGLWISWPTASTADQRMR